MNGWCPTMTWSFWIQGPAFQTWYFFAVSLASEVVVVATPEPTSLTDAYATIKVLVGQQKRQSIRMVINQAARLGDGRAITTQLQQVLDRLFLWNLDAQSN